MTIVEQCIYGNGWHVIPDRQVQYAMPGDKKNRLNKTHNTYNINAIHWENSMLICCMAINFHEIIFL